ncbi:hypothetical protein CBS101457_001996 [Exobasidium rhododendri]|nr:hypothetical protein CBS101457_001996 [Exobasidium rhododendri]
MRISKQVCFLIAAAIASAVDGAPLGDKLERRQDIQLELTPTQKVDVDGSREVPIIHISDQGALQFAPSGCFGETCGAYANGVPPSREYTKFFDSHSTYDPYAENYASPSSFYPPGRVITPPRAPNFPSQAFAIPLSQLEIGQPPVFAPYAGWAAPLIQTGSFQPGMKGLAPTASVPPLPGSFLSPTTTVSAPGAMPGLVPSNVDTPTLPPTTTVGQAPPPLPLPAGLFSKAVLSAPSPAPVPPPASPEDAEKKLEGAPPKPDAAISPPPPPPPPASPKDADKKAEGEPPKPDAALPPTPPPPPPPPAAPTPDEVQKIAEDAKALENKDAPKQRRNFRTGVSKTSPSSIEAKRSATVQRLKKRQFLEPSSVQDCPSSLLETKETLIPVTVNELAQMQQGTAEMISYPSIGQDGQEGQTVYDVVPIEEAPKPLHPSLKDVLKHEAVSMRSEAKGYTSRNRGEGLDDRALGSGLDGQEAQDRIERRDSLEDDDDDDDDDAAGSSLIEKLGKSELHKRLKHESNGLNASLVKNGIGKKKYGYSIHDNNGASSSVSSIGIIGTMTIAAAVGIWTSLS